MFEHHKKALAQQPFLVKYCKTLNGTPLSGATLRCTILILFVWNPQCGTIFELWLKSLLYVNSDVVLLGGNVSFYKVERFPSSCGDLIYKYFFQLKFEEILTLRYLGTITVSNV